MKVMTVLGTRPEIIRLSRTLAALDESFEHTLVHSGQNWHPGLSQIFFDEMGLRAPDFLLSTNTDSLGSFLGSLLREFDEVLAYVKPDALLVLGDTNTALASVMAKRRHIPVYHMEAGNRAFDANVPEEVNRRIVDVVADFNCVYTEHARRNLLREGFEPRRILLTGSPMPEVLRAYEPLIRKSEILTDLNLDPGEYFVMSLHREETVDSHERLNQAFDSVSQVSSAFDLPVIVSVHPRTRRRMSSELLRGLPETLHLSEPLGFFDYVQLQQHARCVLSDSGTISEESAILGFPAVTLRSSIERPEALDAGSIVMTDLAVDDLLAGVELALANREDLHIPAEYAIYDTSRRVSRFIASTAHQHKAWSGIR